jgi:Skp family chaperone for outer membrane proteins
MQSKKLLTLFTFGIAIMSITVVVGSFSKAAVPAKAPDATIGYVDMDRIKKEHPGFINLAEVVKDKEAELNFAKSYSSKQMEIYGRDLKTKMDRETAGKSLNEQEKIEEKYGDQLQAKSKELNTQLSQKTTDINNYINQKRDALMAALRKTVEEVAADMKLTLVLDKAACLYGGVDITQAVLDKAKAGAKTGK